MKKTKKTNFKFKKGDEVMVLKDMTKSYIVESVYKKKEERSSNSMFNIYSTFLYSTETLSGVKVVLDSKVYDESELTFYSEPLKMLAKRVEELEKENKKKPKEEKPNTTCVGTNVMSLNDYGIGADYSIGSNDQEKPKEPWYKRFIV